MTTRRGVALAATLATTALLLGGCAQSRSAAAPDGPPTPPVVKLPRASGKHSVMLYNRFTQRLLAYDTATSAVQSESNEPNFIQYSFPTQSEYYTAGNSAGNDFRVLRVRGDSIEQVLRLPDDEGIFPLATDGSRRFFLHSHYDHGAETGRRVVALSASGTLVPHPKLQGLIDSGALLRDTLYYTTYVESSDDYTLAAVRADDPEASPRVLARGLPAGGLFVHDGALYTSTSDRLVRRGGGRSFGCSEMCYFYDDVGVLVRMHVDGAGSLSLDLVDTRTGRTRATRDDIVDFARSGRKLVVYRTDRVDTIPLPPRRSA